MLMKHTTPPNRTTFDAQVWEFVRQVPHGRVVTYGQVAQSITPPSGVDAQTYKAFGARWVGHAMAACPPDVPWQRVINSQGKVSDRRGAVEQQQRLEAEGVRFTKGKISLKWYQWPGPDHDEQPRQAMLF